MDVSPEEFKAEKAVREYFFQKERHPFPNSWGIFIRVSAKSSGVLNSFGFSPV
jgi:hypothetical protein